MNNVRLWSNWLTHNPFKVKMPDEKAPYLGDYAIKKVKGAANVRTEIAGMIKDVVENPEEQTLYISHADAIDEANAMRDVIMNAVPFKDCFISNIAPIVGASVGPGMIGVYCVGKEVTIEGGN